MTRVILRVWAGLACLAMAFAVAVGAPPPAVSAWIDGTRYAECAVFPADGFEDGQSGN